MTNITDWIRTEGGAPRATLATLFIATPAITLALIRHWLVLAALGHTG